MNVNFLSLTSHACEPMKNFSPAILLILILPVIGCQTGNPDNRPTDKSWIPTWDVRKTIGWHQEKPAAPEIPARIVSTWTDTVLHRTGQKPMRGFGGRLVFFGRDEDEPIPVQGQLVVYSFDETDRDSQDTAPTRKYVFPAEQFVRHESASELGPSYSVWLPWDEVGGLQKNVSLIVRFEPTEGPMILGEQTHHLLPGIALADHGPGSRQPVDYLKAASQLKQPRQSAPASSQVQLASADLPAVNARSPLHGQKPPASRKKMNTTTIRMPAKRTVERGVRSESKGRRSGHGNIQ
jgi:hypothetical protein